MRKPLVFVAVLTTCVLLVGCQKSLTASGQDLKITGVTPAMPNPGDQITITGTDLPIGAEVFIDGVSVKPDSETDTTIVVTIPKTVKPGATVTVKVVSDEEAPTSATTKITMAGVTPVVIDALDGDFAKSLPGLDLRTTEEGNKAPLPSEFKTQGYHSAQFAEYEGKAGTATIFVAQFDSEESAVAAASAWGSYIEKLDAGPKKVSSGQSSTGVTYDAYVAKGANVGGGYTDIFLVGYSGDVVIEVNLLGQNVSVEDAVKILDQTVAALNQ